MGSKRKHKHKIQLIVIELAWRIENKKTSEEKEKAGKYKSWTFRQLVANLDGYSEPLRHDKRDQVLGLVTKIFKKRHEYNDFLRITRYRMQQGETKRALIQELNNAIEATRHVQQAPAHAADEAEEEHQVPHSPRLVVKHAPTQRKKVNRRLVFEPFEVEGLPLIVFGNFKFDYYGRVRIANNCHVAAFLNMPVHMYRSNEPNALFNAYVDSIRAPKAKAIYDELRRTGGVLTKQVCKLKDEYIQQLRDLPGYEESEKAIGVAFPSSTITKITVCSRGCGGRKEETFPAKVEDWDTLRAAKKGDIGIFHCTTCQEEVEGDVEYVLPERAFSINIPKRNLNSTRFFKSFSEFKKQFPTVATLSSVDYKRVYMIITLKKTEKRGRHRIVAYDGVDETGQRQVEVIDSNEPQQLSTPLSVLDFSVRENFVHVNKVVYKRLPGPPRMTDLKLHRKMAEEAARRGENSGSSLPRLRPRK